jgi:hypothetical protein
MAKKVRYNGGNESYHGCSEPKKLVVGMEYEVIEEKDRSWQTDYKLKGVTGYFNSIWIDDVPSVANTFMALARTIPSVGTRCECFKVEFLNGQLNLIGRSTSTVKEVVDMGNNIYRVTTRNSTYIVQVG